MKKNNRKIFITIISILIAVFAITGAVVWWIYRQATRKPDMPEPVRLYVLASSKSAGLRDSLVSSLGEDFGNHVFMMWEHLAKDTANVRTGSYIIRPDENALTIARRVINGMQDPVRVTFNNVRTLDQFSSRVAQSMWFDEEQFSHALDSILLSRDVAQWHYIGRFLPDTYEFYWSAAPEQVINTFTSYYDKFWNEDRLAKARALGLTPDDVATLASIVEEESAKNDERPLIARLYINRLKIGMKLQADPTVKYANGDFAARRITRPMLDVNSPYNTYRYPGLPPGPIRMPSARTLDNVLDAPQHNYLYMCAKEDFSGYHNFASDYATHQRNAARYHEALDKRGIK